MKILKQGRIDWDLNPITFECERCGCVFEANSKEYYQFEANYFDDEGHVSVHCPHCGKYIAAHLK